MNKEQRQVQQAFLDSEKEVLNNLKKNYQDALDEINNKIEILMARQDADMQHVIYQIEYQKALKTQVQSILEQLQTNNFETVSEYLTNCYEDGFIGTMYDLQGQGIPLVMPMDQEQIVAAIQHKTKLSEDLYTSLGKDIKDLQKKISSEISRGISTGQMFSEISRNIAAYAGISRNNAMRIARTEGHRIQIQATMNAQNKAKEKGADIVKQWDSTLDGKTRPHHRMLDGQIRELDEPFEVDGKEVEAPGMFGRPSEDCNCRCALLQRARWALGNDFTKWDQETGGIVEIKADDYDSFKAKYEEESQRVRPNIQKKKEPVVYGHMDITKDFFNKANPQKGRIKESDRYVSPKGYTYKIDGKNVIQNNSIEEIEVARLILDNFGGDIYYIPEVKGKYKGIKTPDYIWNNERFDLKSINGTSKDALRNALSPKRDQAENFIIDISKTTLSNEEIERQIEVVYNSYNTDFVDKLLILKDKKIINVYKRV